MTQAVLLGATIVASASMVVLGVLAIVMGLFRPGQDTQAALGQSDGEAVFLFRDEKLVDCSDQARLLLDTLDDVPDMPAAESALPRLLRYLAPHFDDLRGQLAQLGTLGQVTLQAKGADDGLVLEGSFKNGLARLALSDTRSEGRLVAMDRLSFDTLKSETETLRHALRHAPALIWQTDSDGQVVWANAAYLEQVQGKGRDTALTWPLPALFDTNRAPDAERVSIESDDGPRWFSYRQVPHGAQIMHFAVPIDLAVQTEAARSETLQTLTRTFASLQIGLALFDAERRLQVFNPALVDLTGLDPLFLAGKPSFEQVLFALREARMLPEPKDFNTWRSEIVEMDRAAENGEYAEEWCLEGGRTFHVTGRPQPNGAIALFIEDITTEATLTRSYRAEIDTMHHMLDSLPDGVITFSLAGQTLTSNDAYAAIWQDDPRTDLADKGLAKAIGMWSGQCEPTTFWARLAEFAAATEGEKQIAASIAHKRGALMNVTAQRLRGGSVMVLFQTLGQPVQPARPGGALTRAEMDVHSMLLDRPDAAGPVARRPAGTPARNLPTDPPHAASGAMGQDDPSRRKLRTARHSGSRLRV
jgi:PAS domain-containing protein